MNHLEAIIVAAGYSSRMNAFKPLLPLDGCTVIERAVRSFRSAGVTELSVVVGHQAPEMASVLNTLGVKTVFNANYAEGMFTSILAGVKVLNPMTRGFFLLPGDIPVIKASTINTLQKCFLDEKFGIIHPTYRRRRGHPPVISSCYVSSLEKWKRPGGLKSFFEENDYDAMEIDVDDPGIMLDMDTPDDYEALKNFCTKARPTKDECYSILQAAETPQHVIRHCEKVAQISFQIGSHLVCTGCQLDLALIRAAALLHDIAKGRVDHARTGSELLHKYPDVAIIIAEHMDIWSTSGGPLTEKEIVYLADKIVVNDELIPLEIRFSKALDKHGTDCVLQMKIRQRMKHAENIKSRIEQKIKKPLYELLSTY